MSWVNAYYTLMPIIHIAKHPPTSAKMRLILMRHLLSWFFKMQFEKRHLLK